MMTEDDIRQAVIARGTKRWDRVHSPSLIGRLLSPLFGGNLDAVLMIEHDAADSDSLECVGNIIAAWQQDDHGLNSIDPSHVDPGPLRGNRWSKHVLRFHISRDHSQVIANEMEGPDQGTLIQFKVKPQGSNVCPGAIALPRDGLFHAGWRGRCVKTHPTGLKTKPRTCLRRRKHGTQDRSSRVAGIKLPCAVAIEKSFLAICPQGSSLKAEWMGAMPSSSWACLNGKSTVPHAHADEGMAPVNVPNQPRSFLVET